MSSSISDSYPGPTLSPLISQKGNFYTMWLEFLPLSLSTFLLYARCKLSLKLIPCCTIASSAVIQDSYLVADFHTLMNLGSIHSFIPSFTQHLPIACYFLGILFPGKCQLITQSLLLRNLFSI